MSKPYVGWGITYQGDLLESTIRIFRKFAIEDYIKSIDLPGLDWKQAKIDDCRVVKVWIYLERPKV